MNEDPELVERLRAAGCVFAEDEARLLTEAAAAVAPDGTAPAGGASGGEITLGARVDPEKLERMVAARIAGAPLEQVLGWAELWGRRWAVAPGVFVPRRRSELLVTEALAHLHTHSGAGRAAAAPGAAVPTWPPAVPPTEPVPRPGRAGPDLATPASAVVVDVCCGCGALGGAVALDLIGDGYDVELHASDLDPAATECARKNLTDAVVGPGSGTGGPAAVGPGSGAGRLAAVVHDGDLDGPLPDSLRGRVDILLCNAPYVPSEAIALMPREARDHEPRHALDGGADGLGILRRAIAAAPGWLRPGGALLFETGRDQAESAAAAARDSGLAPRIVSDDDLGATAVIARRPPPR
ncbi:putative protein N(5)-glutamine methyltransferase [Myceligenerans pegani]|uniref:Release factor glutamine methyltransferase n=1 Tax=Myceligenerans pegani TaxID=2776917 RepID=A0ABR9MW57_9MICO|nr:putative protein N(5)-glutamine methyltransferase [Myceligenerans sp. TRM 65318]MBE1875624.1 putative protein N(5)-glutamine methyltransferase [Myceligenerans sp. TRM 65318]MBE3017895.1 putative protein N(5)-glutamine methyltransferase [Myceligenerans sp. TRM 65318]